MTAHWLPRFVCPDCRQGAVDDAEGGVMCACCHTRFGPRDGVYRFLSTARAAAAAPFERQYRVVREREGFRTGSPDYYRALPSVPPDDRHAGVWRVRRESFTHLLSEARRVASGRQLRVLDLGAGNAWLSHRLTAAGHYAVAVDRLDDEADGLGACRHYSVPIVAVQADFDALPFEPAQFDLAVFDGSLHYSPDPRFTLAEARRMLAPGGAVAVMDSPMFADEGDGRAMVANQRRKLAAEHGIDNVAGPGVGFLTYGTLDGAASILGLRGLFVPSNGSIGWRVRRQFARLRLGRAPAAFGVWVAQ